MIPFVKEHLFFDVGLTIEEDHRASLGKRYLTAAITSRATQRVDKHLKERYRRRLEKDFACCSKELEMLHMYFHSYHRSLYFSVWISFSLNSTFPSLMFKQSFALLLLWGWCSQECISLLIFEKPPIFKFDLMTAWAVWEGYTDTRL